jgi:hypothetical protein
MSGGWGPSLGGNLAAGLQCLGSGLAADTSEQLEKLFVEIFVKSQAFRDLTLANG